MTWKRSGLVALAAILVTAACSTADPAPWTSQAAGQQPYRGTPTALSLSGDGSRIAIAYSDGDRNGGVAVVDGQTGAVLTVRDYPGERFSNIALSPSGDRILRLTRTCRSSVDCGPTRAVETEVATGRDTVLGEDSPRLLFNYARLIGYDPQNEDRVVLLLPPTPNPPDYMTRVDSGRVVHIDRRRPGTIDRVFALDSTDDREVIAKAVSLGGGIVAVLEGRSSSQGAPSIVVLPPPPRPSSAPMQPPARVEMLRLTADGRRMLVFITASREGAETQEAALLDAGGPSPQGQPANGRRLTRQEGGFIREGAISADGRRAALIIEPVTGSDPQPVLWIADLDEAEPQARATRTLADLSVGRTPYGASMPSEELLRRLRVVAEGGRLQDLPFILATLGLRVQSHRVYGTTDHYSLHGDIAPRGNVTIERGRHQAAVGREETTWGVLRMMDEAGPCLTVPDAIRILGDPEPDRRDLRMIPQYNPLTARVLPPSSQSRNEVTVRYRSGLEISLTFYRQHCASGVSVRTARLAR